MPNPNSNSPQIITHAYLTQQLNNLRNLITDASSGVTSFNTRNGVVSLLLADVTGVGGAPIASPTFTGVPAAPTAAPGTNTTQIATTAFVLANAGGGNIKSDGSVAFTSPQPFAAGAVGAPAITFTGQTDMGLYKISSTQLGVAVSGALSLVVNTTGIAVGQIDELDAAVGIKFSGTGTADFTGMTSITASLIETTLGLTVNGGLITDAGGLAGVATWRLGTRITGASVLDAAHYIEVEIGGAIRKLCIAN